MIELKPCSECKGTPEYRRVGDRKQYWVVICSICGHYEAGYSEACLTKQGAKRLWNRRVKQDDNKN